MHIFLGTSKISIIGMDFLPVHRYMRQGLSQDLETRCLKLAIVKILGVQMFKGDHNIYSYFNHKHVLIYQNKA